MAILSSNKWISITYRNLYLRIGRLLLNSDYIIDHFFGFSIFIIWTLYKDISALCLGHFLLCYLYLGTTLQLQLSNGLASFTNDQPNNIIGHRYDICHW